MSFPNSPAVYLCLRSGVLFEAATNKGCVQCPWTPQTSSGGWQNRTLLLIHLRSSQGYFHTSLLYMAKFLAELLGCTLPDKGTPPLIEVRMLQNAHTQDCMLFMDKKSHGVPIHSMISLWQHEAEALFITMIDSCHDVKYFINSSRAVSCRSPHTGTHGVCRLMQLFPSFAHGKSIWYFLKLKIIICKDPLFLGGVYFLYDLYFFMSCLDTGPGTQMPRLFGSVCHPHTRTRTRTNTNTPNLCNTMFVPEDCSHIVSSAWIDGYICTAVK